MRSTSGFKPVISQSNQTRFLSDLLKGVLLESIHPLSPMAYTRAP
jgi:hypothetical protein